MHPFALSLSESTSGLAGSYHERHSLSIVPRKRMKRKLSLSVYSKADPALSSSSGPWHVPLERGRQNYRTQLQAFFEICMRVEEMLRIEREAQGKGRTQAMNHGDQSILRRKQCIDLLRPFISVRLGVKKKKQRVL